METIKIVVTGSTGANPLKGTLYLSSGVIAFEDGSFTHIQNEITKVKSVVAESTVKIVEKEKAVAEAGVQSKKNKKFW